MKINKLLHSDSLSNGQRVLFGKKTAHTIDDDHTPLLIVKYCTFIVRGKNFCFSAS